MPLHETPQHGRRRVGKKVKIIWMSYLPAILHERLIFWKRALKKTPVRHLSQLINSCFICQMTSKRSYISPKPCSLSTIISYYFYELITSYKTHERILPQHPTADRIPYDAECSTLERDNTNTPRNFGFHGFYVLWRCDDDKLFETILIIFYLPRKLVQVVKVSLNFISCTGLSNANEISTPSTIRKRHLTRYNGLIPALQEQIVY